MSLPEPCAAAVAQAPSEGQNSVSNQHGDRQPLAARALDCSDDGVRGESATNNNNNNNNNNVRLYVSFSIARDTWRLAFVLMMEGSCD